MSNDAVKFSFAFIAPLAIMGVVGFFIEPAMIPWFWAWAVIVCTILIAEVIGVNTGVKKTISRRFWEFKEKHPVWAAIWWWTWLLFFVYLFAHLWFKV